MYAVAKSLPESARRVACEARYTINTGLFKTAKRTSDGYCPLGIIAEYMGIIDTDFTGDCYPKAPTPILFHSMCVKAGLVDVSLEDVYAFVAHWDSGFIGSILNPLNRALGVN